MTTETIRLFQNKLLKWYGENARILPWRDDPSPYRVWISEVMLQQTRVETVKPYFERFMKEVPSIEALANISEEKLLKLWEGLGYYSRAKNLKKAALMIIQDFDGKIPTDMKDLKSLPGIGPYTSGAIASIAFGMRVPAIDGNVLRVLARITANKGDITNPSVKKEIEEDVNKILPMTGVGDFNQALMELGATLCLPADRLKCYICPVNFICEGNKQGIAPMLPVKAKKKARRIERKTVFLISFENKIALRQRDLAGLLSGLWEFPHVEGHLSYEECMEEMKKREISVQKVIPLQKSKHIFTHLEWHMIGYLIHAQKLPMDSELLWATQNEIDQQYTIPSAFKAYRAEG